MGFAIMYRTRVKPAAVYTLEELREEFRAIYATHGIDIVGHWRNANDPTENYYIARYESDEDYEVKMAKLHDTEEYVRLTSKLNEIRIDFSSTRLIPE